MLQAFFICGIKREREEKRKWKRKKKNVSQGMSLNVRSYSTETHVLSVTLGDNDSFIIPSPPEKDRDCPKWFTERRVR